MKTITVQNNILSTPSNYYFIPLGNSDKIFGNGGLLDQVRDRIFKRNSSPVEDFWATVGREDGQKINWQGSINASNSGNDRSTGITSDEIDFLKQLHPEIKMTGKRALEKVIDFDNVVFPVNDPDSRKMRLTVMVEPGEGALVYYHHTDKSDTTAQNGVIEYIHPANTPNYSDNERDRLDYLFEVPPIGPNERFIVKAITFQRDPKQTSEALLRKIEKPYRLLLYNPNVDDTENEFIGSFQPIATFNDNGSVNGSLPNDLRTKKTLLLVHGTFSTTDNSYKGLLTSGWLKNLITTKQYDQVLAIDHPTVFDGPAANVQKMVQLMGPGQKFTQPVHVITTSRGGLVGKTIVNDKTINEQLFTVERVAAVACANGVEYFSAGWKITKGLAIAKNLFKITGRTGLATFTAIAEVGCEYFLTRDGCVAMTPGSKPLTAILNGTPANAEMRYYPLTGNYSPDDLKQRILNCFIELVYRKDPNDWVVGTKQQAIMPTANYAYGKTKGWGYDYYFSNTYDSIHTQYFIHNPPPDSVPRDTVLKFLKDEYANIL